METMNNGAIPVYDVACNDKGFGNSNIWLFLLLFLFIGGTGFGFGGNGALQREGQSNMIANEFLQRDIFGMNQGLGNSIKDCCCNTQKEIIENRYTNQLGLQNLGQQMSNCCCETQRSIDAARAEAYKNTCDITTAIHAEGEQTRALINANSMQELRDKLEERGRNLATAEFQLSQLQQTGMIINQLQPTPRPAYLTCSPFGSNNPYSPYGICNGYGHDI